MLPWRVTVQIANGSAPHSTASVANPERMTGVVGRIEPGGSRQALDDRGDGGVRESRGLNVVGAADPAEHRPAAMFACRDSHNSDFASCTQRSGSCALPQRPVREDAETRYALLHPVKLQTDPQWAGEEKRSPLKQPRAWPP
jgi:hypothetical protein